MVINEFSLRALTGFYENELVNNFLSFWLPRCEDKENGGFLNCFDNKGEHLVSKNKYCWSQGRFVWIFSKLASTEAPIFSDAQRAEFLQLAKNGADFLEAHALIPGRDICSFLLDEKGEPIFVDGADRLDMSIYADCFVIAGMAMYALQSGEESKYRFAKDLYLSVLDRVEKNDFQTLPYPLSKSLRAHGIPMILSNISKDIHFAAKRFEPEYAGIAAENMWRFSSDTLSHFMDGDHLIHEVITADNRFFPQTLGDHINPGHSIEDAWFMLDSAEINGHRESFADIFQMVLSTLDAGWDEQYGGILHFASVRGGEPDGDNSGFETEPMSVQLSGWGDKLWWPHSEALYTTLRCYAQSGDARFLDWHEKVFNYAYSTFPNTDPNIREWVQIRERNGNACEKVVALPVKDPYHVMRNLILIIELLYKIAAGEQ